MKILIIIFIISLAVFLLSGCPSSFDQCIDRNSPAPVEKKPNNLGKSFTDFNDKDVCIFRCAVQYQQFKEPTENLKMCYDNCDEKF